MADESLVNLDAIARSIAPWVPHPALTANQATLRVVKYDAHGPPLHHHDIDECYVVLDGELVLELAGEATIHLKRGDAYVVRAGVGHRPMAMPTASVLLIT